MWIRQSSFKMEKVKLFAYRRNIGLTGQKSIARRWVMPLSLFQNTTRDSHFATALISSPTIFLLNVYNHHSIREQACLNEIHARY